MIEQKRGHDSWSKNLVATTSIILTICLALIMSQLDSLQLNQPNPPTPIGIVIAPEQTNTPNPTRPLATATSTNTTPTLPPLPTSDEITPTSSPTLTPIDILPQCRHTPEHWSSYITQANDTLTSLAAARGTTVAAIMQANCLDMTHLIEGMRLFLPAQPPTRLPCGPPSWWVRYTVQQGDTMFSLARLTNTTIFAILNANCLSSTSLITGRQLYLPKLPQTATPIPPSATATPTPSSTTTASPTPTPVTLFPTATHTPATSHTPTSTPSPTQTPTPTNTPTMTTTLAPSATHTPTLMTNTPTLEPTATNTPTPPASSPTWTPSPTPTPSSKHG